jgi:hypothetical protein
MHRMNRVIDDAMLDFREVKWMGHFIAGKRVIKEDVSQLICNSLI